MKLGMRVVGNSVPLNDAYEKVTGCAKFTADIQLPHMLYGKILRSPHPHAIVKQIDASSAEAYAGVRAVITSRDVPQIPFYPGQRREMLVLDEHLRCLGDEVAALAAETEESAEQALKHVDVEYTILPAVFDAVEAAKADAPELHAGGNIADPEGKPLILEWGSPSKAFREADLIVQDIFRTQMQVHTPMEPRACVVDWESDNLTVWVTTQTPHVIREQMARLLRLPLSKVRIITDYIGGGFGGKKEERYPFIAALLAKKSGRPVKLEYTRTEEHTVAARKFSSTAHVKIGARKDGTLVAIDYECFYNIGAYGNPLTGSLFFSNSFLYTYKFENARFVGWDVNTNLANALTFRGVPFPAYHFAVDQLIDQVAEGLNVSPIEIRLKNTYRNGDKMAPFGATLTGYGIEECVMRVEEASAWNRNWEGWAKAKMHGPKKRGIGFATSMGWCTLHCEKTSAIIKVETDGSAVVVVGTQDLGTGSKTALCQIAAEVLGLTIQDISIVAGDTKVTPSDIGCYASRTLYVGGLAVKGAAEDARQKILKMAADLLNTETDKLELQEKRVYVRDEPERVIPLSELLHTTVTGTHSERMREQVAPLRDKVYVGAAVAHAAQVEVDIETGEVKVLNYAAAHDLGRAINPSIVENQIFGAIIQGLGYTLTEELIFDQSRLAYLNPDYADYKILTALDTPRIDPIIIESNDSTGPFGAKGVGEPAINITAAVISNAIYAAIGVRMRELPVTPERILKSLRRI